MVETVCGALRTAVTVFAHRFCAIWCKSPSQSLKCRSLTPHEAPELAELQADIVAGISARDNAAMEKSFRLVFEVLCGATATLVQLLDCRPPHSLYTFASEAQPSVRDSCVFCASSGGLS